jgi:hypothetical protein
VHVALGPWAMVLPGRATVGRAHEPAQLDARQDDVCVVRARRNPADMRRPRAWRKTPGRSRRKLAQRGKLLPVAVTASPERARLAARIGGAVGRAVRDREDSVAGRPAFRHVAPPSPLSNAPPSRQPARTRSGLHASTATHCAPASSRARSARPSATRMTASPVATKSGFTSWRRGRDTGRRRTRGRSRQDRGRTQSRGRTPAGSRP